MKFLRCLVIPCWILFLTSATAAAAGAKVARIAVCGDSISTGAATHPVLEFDSNNLWAVLNGGKSVPASTALVAGIESVFPKAAAVSAGLTGEALLPPPQRAWPTIKEYRSSVEWVGLGLLRTVSESYLDTEEFSWGYLLGRAYAIEPEQILIAAENGARSAAATAQMARILEANSGVLPEKIFLFFTGNDVCAARTETMTASLKFEQNIFRALHHALRQGRAAPGGTDIIVPAFVNVTQLLTNQAIQTKLVRAFGSKISCAKLRENQFVQVLAPVSKEAEPGLPPEATLLSQVLPPNPAAMCPTLFARDLGTSETSERIGAIANRIREFRTSAQNAVRRASSLQKEKFPDSNIRFHFVDETANMPLEAEDVAEDCFHLTIRGQAKLARVIFDAESMRTFRSGGQ